MAKKLNVGVTAKSYFTGLASTRPANLCSASHITVYRKGHPSHSVSLRIDRPLTRYSYARISHRFAKAERASVQPSCQRQRFGIARSQRLREHAQTTARVQPWHVVLVLGATGRTLLCAVRAHAVDAQVNLRLANGSFGTLEVSGQPTQSSRQRQVPGLQRCGSSTSISLARWVGRRSSTSLGQS